MAYAPEVLLGLLLYGYATGTFSTRKLEQATAEQIPYRYIAGNMKPDHDTINEFRKNNLAARKGLFVQVLLMAHFMGYVKLGNSSIDSSKIHADASKSKAVSYGRISQLEERLQKEIDELFALAEQAESVAGDDFDGDHEIGIRRSKLASLAQAKTVLEHGMQPSKPSMHAKWLLAKPKTGKKSRGRAPEPPEPGPGEKDQDNFTDPASHIMKNGNNQGFEQAYNAQIAVEHASRLIVGNTLSNHSNDKQEALPTAQAIPAELGTPAAAALDNGYFSLPNMEGLAAMGITPYIATGRDRHQLDWRTFLAGEPEPPPQTADYIVQMAYQLRTQAGKAVYKLRKSTVEPVLGIIKEILGFRQFSLRGLTAAAGEGNLVCLAYNLKRLHTIASAA